MLGGGPSARGFNATWDDSAYDLGLDPVFQNIPHTGATLTVEWFASGAGWQGDNARFGETQDESWAIDNVRVDLNGVHAPLPSHRFPVGLRTTGPGSPGLLEKEQRLSSHPGENPRPGPGWSGRGISLFTINGFQTGPASPEGWVGWERVRHPRGKPNRILQAAKSLGRPQPPSAVQPG